MGYFWFFLILAVIFIVYSIYEANILTVKEFNILIPNLPESFNGLKIAYISDIHLGPFISIKKVKKICEKTNSLGCDIVLLGGDYVETPNDNNEKFFNNVNFKAPMGVYGVLGNHDYKKGFVDSKKYFEKKGWSLLINEGVHISNKKDKIFIGGVDDYTDGHPDIKKTLKEKNENEISIILSHNPKYADFIESGTVDLILSGHTHGGQITFFGLFPKSGFKENEKNPIIISHGIGTTYLPMRFFCHPQILKVKLNNKK